MLSVIPFKWLATADLLLPKQLPTMLLSNIACLYHHIELEDVGTLTYYLEQYQSLLPHVSGGGEVMLPKVQYL